MSAKVQFIQTRPEQLEQKISNAVKRQLDEFLKQFKPKLPNEYVTKTEVSNMFNVSLSTVNNWSKSNKINPLAIGGRVYFLRSDIEASLIPLND